MLKTKRSLHCNQQRRNYKFYKWLSSAKYNQNSTTSIQAVPEKFLEVVEDQEEVEGGPDNNEGEEGAKAGSTGSGKPNVEN